MTTQIHVRATTARFPHDPPRRSSRRPGRPTTSPVRTAGAAVVGNNLGAALDAAREDAAYARILFLFLGLPGAVLAAALTAAVTQAGADRRRREQALLRARGSTPAQLLRLVLVEAAAVGVLGGVVGLGHRRGLIGAAGSWQWDLVAGGLAGLLIAALVVAVPAARDLAQGGRRRVARWYAGTGHPPGCASGSTSG